MASGSGRGGSEGCGMAVGDGMDVDAGEDGVTNHTMPAAHAPGTVFYDDDDDPIYVSRARETPMELALRFQLPISDVLTVNEAWNAAWKQPKLKPSQRLCEGQHVLLPARPCSTSQSAKWQVRCGCRCMMFA